jgi:hypothetical protein
MITFFEKILYFLPFVILLLVSTLFFMLSFSVFDEGSLFQQITGFLIQNIPTVAILLLTFFSKNHPKIGGIILIIIWGFFFFFFHAYQNLSLLLMIIPILIAGLLFFFRDKLSH